MVGAAVALSAAATLGVVTLATPASAAYVGSATFKASTLEKARTDWGKGWDKCRDKYPQTKSVEFAGWADSDHIARWICYDDPNKTW